MALSQHASERRSRIFEDLKAGLPPREGEFSEHLLKEGRSKGEPQMGSLRFEPEAILCEFIYPDAQSSSTILTVRLDVPERIVFLPVPSWVIESIWQGDITGSHHFESDAEKLVSEFQAELPPEANLRWFGPQPAKRRE